jgi:hypothetical protein
MRVKVGFVVNEDDGYLTRRDSLLWLAGSDIISLTRDMRCPAISHDLPLYLVP